MLVKWLKTILSFNSNQNTIKMNITDANRLLSGRSEVRIPSGTLKNHESFSDSWFSYYNLIFLFLHFLFLIKYSLNFPINKPAEYADCLAGVRKIHRKYNKMRRSYLLYCRLDNISAVFLPFSELNAVEQDSVPADFDQL